MLATLRRLPAPDRATREGRGWPSDPQPGETVRDIGACAVGLVGYGNIAKHVAGIVAAMGATVLHSSTRDDGLPGWRPLPGLLAAAGLDVFDVEPVLPGNPLLSLDNVLLTPHVSWYTNYCPAPPRTVGGPNRRRTAATRRRWLTQALNNPANCRRLLDRKRLAHVVNQPTGLD